MPVSASTVNPYSAYIQDGKNEPVELRDLKMQLAKLQCKSARRNKLYSRGVLFQKEVQADLNNSLTIKPPSSVTSEWYPSHSTLSRAIRSRGSYCHNCLAACDLLRLAVPRVVKDEQSETNSLITCNKSTAPDDGIERTITGIIKLGSSTLNLGGVVTRDDSSSTACSKPNRFNRDKVKFSDGYHQRKLCYYTSDVTELTGIEKFIDAVRPPLKGYFNNP